MTLRFSIVVPTLDRKSMLLQALTSIDAQQWGETEVIVVDGGSNDGTVEEISRRAGIHLLRGPDQGVYDAFNKGIAQATGDVVAILNSDDLYEPDAFAAVAAGFAEEPRAQCVCGSAVLADGDRLVQVFDLETDKLLSSPRSSLIGSCILNARFFRRPAMLQIGRFDPDLRLVSDRDWLTRWYESGLLTVTVPNRVYRYRRHAGSLTFDLQRRREYAIRKELMRMARRWRDAPNAKPETKQAARLLEGRCVAVLAARAVSTGHLLECGHWLLTRDGRPSLDPLVRAAHSGIDWAAQALRSRRPLASSSQVTPK